MGGHRKIMTICLQELDAWRVGGLIGSVLHSGSNVWVQALVRAIVLCSWERQFTLTVHLSTQVYKWVPANLMLGVILQWTSIPYRGE